MWLCVEDQAVSKLWNKCFPDIPDHVSFKWLSNIWRIHVAGVIISIGVSTVGYSFLKLRQVTQWCLMTDNASAAKLTVRALQIEK